MLEELARVAAYGASASFGRDVYRSLRNRGGLVLFLAGAFLTTFGFRHMVMGHDRGWFGTLCLTIIGSTLMILVGMALVIPPLIFLWAYVVQDMPQAPLIIAGVFLAYFVISMTIGLVWGFGNRSARKLAKEVEQHNTAFLAEHGFQDLGLGEGIIEDGDGNRLKLRENDEEQNRLVFMGVGQRNVRAAIQLDEAGRMLSYTGAMKL